MSQNLNKHLLSFLILCLGTLTFSNASCFPIEPKDKDLKVFTQKYSFGTVVRKEWRANQNSSLYRLEIDNATAGKMLIDKTRLTYNTKDGWKLTDFEDKLLLTISQEDIEAKKYLTFKNNNQEWDLLIRGQNIPKEIPGIATEDENSLNLTLTRIR
jgi:hypothetical protein